MSNATPTEPENPTAFPVNYMDFSPASGEQVVREQFEGLSMRDYFAAKAIPQLVSEWGEDHDEIASEAYKIADAMLKARAAK